MVPVENNPNSLGSVLQEVLSLLETAQANYDNDHDGSGDQCLETAITKMRELIHA